MTLQLSLFHTHYGLNRKENIKNRKGWALFCFVRLLGGFLVGCDLFGFFRDSERFLKRCKKKVSFSLHPTLCKTGHLPDQVQLRHPETRGEVNSNMWIYLMSGLQV